jgi:hypothetical protein
VPVDLQRERHIGVAEPIIDEPRIEPRGQEVRCVPVAQIVKSNPRKSRPVDGSGESPRDHVRVPGPTVDHREDEVAVDPAGTDEEPLLTLRGSVGSEHRDRLGVEIQDAPGPV